MPIENKNKRWADHPLRLPDGHKLFRSNAHLDRYALADDSAYFPEYTDDGVLWLDTSRPLSISIGTSDEHAKEIAFIPLVDPHGDQSTTISNMHTLLRLATMFAWPIRNETGQMFRILRVHGT